MIGYITGFTEEKLEQIAKDPYYSKKVKKIIEYADAKLLEEPARIKYSEMHLVETTGDRATYENVIIDYGLRMKAYALAYRFTGDEKYIMPLADIIWNICNLESWAFPFHVKESESIDRRYRWLELGSCNVGRELGEVLFLTESVLPELVVRRAKHEVRERVVEGYKRYNQWWMTTKNNWASVCIAGVLGSYLYFATDEEIKEQLPRMLKVGENFLMGFDPEGCCLEGYGYWNYGFSYYCIFADLVLNYTKGEINLFDNPRVHDIAKFSENCAINEKECVRFADCATEFFAPPLYLAHYLKKVYPDVQIPPTLPPDDFIPDIRMLIWPDPALQNVRMDGLKSKIYEGAQWFIHRGKNYNAACKAGCNNEYHNHNDVGSFMISKGGKVTFTDPGSGDYTAQYFGAERYTILEPSARSHSVPIINGILQKEQLVTKSTIYVANENEYKFSMDNGYVIDTLKSLTRDFLCEENGITLTDTYEFSEMPTSIVERFVTLVEPKIEEGRITVGESTLVYDPALYDFEFLTDTCVRRRQVKETLYIFDFKPKCLDKNMTLEFKFI